MREIKFRAWDKNLKGWIVEKIFFSDSIAWIKRGDMLVKCDTEVMQFTGLHDKNGKEIWEGDIVRNESNIPLNIEIIWDEIEGGWSLGNDGIGLKRYQLSEFWEVIGNIYENPNLLK